MTAGNPGSATHSGPTLTETGMSQPGRGPAPLLRSDSSSISWVSSCIRPSWLASEVNSAGDSVPSSGCSQRASDSAATARPDDSSTSGWK